MSLEPILYWFRNDLRLHDNPAFNEALLSRRPIVPVYIIDPQWFSPCTPLGFPRMGVARHRFLLESLVDLKSKLESMGNTLHLFEGSTAQTLSAIYSKTKATAIIAQKEFAHDEIGLEETLSQTVNLELYWGSMLYPPDRVDFSTDQSPFYFTRFKNRVNQLSPFSLLSTPTTVPSLSSLSLSTEIKEISSLLPPLQSRSALFPGGETNALERLNTYLVEEGPLHYAKTRNLFEGKNFSTLLGAWLANGALSPRLVLHRLNQVREAHPQQLEEIQPLIDQLIWRDYFRFLFLRYGMRFFTLKGLRKSDTGMHNDVKAFEQWQKGETGHPLIDALMRQLSTTGFMSNRGRMLVSFFLSKEMKVNWQWGASWFESALLDYDVCSNYGNWAYQSGRGTDSRVNRRFNLDKQAAKFDPDGSFVERWQDKTL